MLASIGPKKSKSLKTLEHNTIPCNKKQESNKFTQFNLTYRRYHEPIAIKHYESYTN